MTNITCGLSATIAGLNRRSGRGPTIPELLWQYLSYFFTATRATILMYYMLAKINLTTSILRCRLFSVFVILSQFSCCSPCRVFNSSYIRFLFSVLLFPYFSVYGSAGQIKLTIRLLCSALWSISFRIVFRICRIEVSQPTCVASTVTFCAYFVAVIFKDLQIACILHSIARWV